MSITRSESNFYKKNGYLLKHGLISKNEIKKLNVLIKNIVTKEKNSKKKLKIKVEHKVMIIITLYSTVTHQKIKKY